jgi:CcdB protein
VVVRQYDVVRNNDSTAKSITPYLFVLQHNFNSPLPSVIAAPISVVTLNKVISKLDVPILVQGKNLHIRVQYLAAVPQVQLRTVVENRDDLHDLVIAAIDKLFSGY